ncbi:MAG: ribosomal subunit interface protein [Chitinophagaceae bacterium]
MTIQINSDNNIKGSEGMISTFESVISTALDRYSGQLTRIEAHFSDENSHKSGQLDKKCLLEARLEGMQPLAVTNHGNTLDQALRGAIDKIKTSIDTAIGRLRNH